MKNLIVVIIICFIGYGCNSYNRIDFVPFEFKNGTINFKYKSENYSLESEEFRCVYSWAEYSKRSLNGTGKTNGAYFYFVGAINHSRDIIFIYNFKSGTLFNIPNGENIILDSDGWACVQLMPLYAEHRNGAFIVLNDKVVAGMEEASDFKKMYFRNNELIVQTKKKLLTFKISDYKDTGYRRTTGNGGILEKFPPPSQEKESEKR